MKKTLIDVLIIGAGPAGLTCAVEILKEAPALDVLVVEADSQVGGISKTVVCNGNRMDLGGHRFFSKSDWVMSWWRERFPLAVAQDSVITYQGRTKTVSDGSEVGVVDGRELLLRNRLSRIFYRGKFFDYPLKFNFDTFRKLGVFYSAACGLSLLKAKLMPRSEEKSLEDFLVNRFGNKLYRTFFKSYTEKVWGVECEEISAEWGAQRIKGVSIRALLSNYLAGMFRLGRKEVKTSLIEQFLYPRLGPGELWEYVADEVRQAGGSVILKSAVSKIRRLSDNTFSVDILGEDGAVRTECCRHLVSTMPISHLLAHMNPAPPLDVQAVSDSLPYRDFISVGLLLNKMGKHVAGCSVVDGNNMPADNWIYIQEEVVRVGRIQIFNNWSPYLVTSLGKVWLGMEYFCTEGDDLWSMDDKVLMDFATNELCKIGFLDKGETPLDGCVVRVPKAYPAYFGVYSDFGKVRAWLDTVPNLFVIGRNGMHRYNNQDHSMLTARYAAESIVTGRDLRSLIWAVNIDDEYHEEQHNESTLTGDVNLQQQPA